VSPATVDSTRAQAASSAEKQISNVVSTIRRFSPSFAYHLGKDPERPPAAARSLRNFQRLTALVLLHFG
jgi:hypothetical protein